jgi:hypothetical protein
MSRGFGSQINPNERLALPSQSRTIYEAPGWGELSIKEIVAMRERMDASRPDIATDAKIRSMEGELVIEISGMLTNEQIARLHQWGLHEEALPGSTNSLRKAATNHS